MVMGPPFTAVRFIRYPFPREFVVNDGELFVAAPLGNVGGGVDFYLAGTMDNRGWFALGRDGRGRAHGFFAPNPSPTVNYPSK